MLGSFQILLERDNWKDCCQPQPASQGCKRLLKAQGESHMMARLLLAVHMKRGPQRVVDTTHSLMGSHKRGLEAGGSI